MSTDQKSLEVKVGLFVFVGLLAIAVMAIQFGRLGQGIGGEYSLTVEFQNAGGLIKDGQVQLSGAVIGHIAETPEVDLSHIGTVFVKLQIKESVRLPVNSTFVIGSSGMLGDKFVQITPPPKFDPKKFNPNDPTLIIAKGAIIRGTQDSNGFDALASQASQSMDKLKTTLDEINTKLPEILSEENIGNLRSAFASVKTTADNFASASKKVGDVVIGAQSAVDSAKETMATARQTMTTANAAAGDIRAAVGDVRGVVQSAQGVLKSTQSGPGVVPMLIGNREVADNLRALISNIRRHGLLFYHDSAQADAAPATAAKAKAQ